MNEEQIADLHRRGHVIGSHSCSHPVPITALGDHELDREWRQSCDVLADILGQPCRVGSVPGGFLSGRVIASAARAGIEQLFTSEPTTAVHRHQDCTVLGRYMVKHGTPAQVAADIARGKLRPRLQQWVFWNGKKGIKRIGGKYWLRVRKYLLSR
jgi:peptidoglycan/xylan/chitin deacetylase (PgdA/CDA1 family)